LDLDAMTHASRYLIGRRDFSAVAGAGAGVPGSETNCERHVLEAGWREVPQEIEPGSGPGTLLEFRIKANAFLPHMVRNIVGDLVSVGRCERTPAWMEEIIQGRDRRAGAPAAPPQGLALWKVTYSDFDESSKGVAVSDGARGGIGVTNQ
jgi:tRNA pseudouridine38-40 synthase